MKGNKSERAYDLRKSMIVLWSMVTKNIKRQYRKSVLGILWTVLNPLLTMLIMVFVFSQIFRFGDGIDMDYPLYILTGNIIFSFMNTATSQALPCMVTNYDLMTKTRLPYTVFPVSYVLSSLVNFGFSLIALLLVMIVRIPSGNVVFSFTMFMTICPFLPAFLLFCTGISFLLCTIYVRFRDIKYLYGVFLTLWMYLTPIFYPISKLSEVAQTVIQINPMYHYLTYFRQLINGVVPSLETHLIIYGWGIIMLLLGWLIFKSQKRKFILYI